jgi:precorrin-2 dehydrogenase/sirohydrochlorin ferrochelatase
MTPRPLAAGPAHPVFPVGLLLAGRKCLVVGGGKVAARKIRGLLACGASVTVVAPEVHEAIELLARGGDIERNEGPPIEVHVREYQPGEARGYSLVVSATGDPMVAETVYRDAQKGGVWVNTADDAKLSTFILPAVVRDGPVTVTVSTSGASPALSSWLRDRLRAALGTGIGELADLLAEARQRLKARGSSTAAVNWRALLDGDLPGLVSEGRIEEARSLLESRTTDVTPAD